MLLSGRGGGGGIGNGGGCRYPFTASQWQELEHQALIFKYMVSGVPIPPDLLFSVRRSFLDSSSFPHTSSTSPHMGWNCFQMGLGMRKIDPEPGRCRRTDGKKWRCSKEAFQDSKYCEKHMHRGKNRSRKPVEPQQQQHVLSSGTYTTSASMVKPTTKHSSSLSSSLTSDYHHQHQLYPHSYSYSNNTTSTRPYHHQSKALGSGTTQLGLHRVVDENEHSAFNEDSWQLTPLKMSSASGGGRMSSIKHQQEYPPYFQFGGYEDYESSRTCDDDGDDDDHGNRTRTEKKVYRFLEECPPDNNINSNSKDSPSWLNLDDNKSSNCSSSSTTQLSISIPSTSTTSHHHHHQLFPIFNSRPQNADSHF